MLQVGIGEASRTSREVQASGSCEEEVHEQRHVAHHDHHQQQQQQQQIATTSFHMISRPSHPISTIISPPPLNHTSINILDDNSYQVSTTTMMLQNDNFQVIITQIPLPKDAYIVFTHFPHDKNYFTH